MEKRGFSISESLACKIIFQLCCAVSYLHYYKILHRNIKPENIFLTNDTDLTDIRLGGFSICRILHNVKLLDEYAGTIHYCSPEVLSHEPHGFSSDIWSIGVISYFMLSGILPFHAEKDYDTAQKIIHSDLEFPEELWKYHSRESKLFVASKQLN